MDTRLPKRFAKKGVRFRVSGRGDYLLEFLDEYLAPCWYELRQDVGLRSLG